jgi:hypothetical protein
VTAALTGPGAAYGSHPLLENGGVASASEEAAIRAQERSALGKAHARDHAIQRRALRRAQRRWKRMSRSERRARIAEDRRAATRYAEATQRASGPEAEAGAWTTTPFPLPNFAIHSAMLPTGKVLFWGYPPIVNGSRENVGLAALWDPATGEFEDASPPLIDIDGNGTLEPAPIYCSGQSFLATGEVVLAGGNLLWPQDSGGVFTSNPGAKFVYTFDPFEEEWVRQPDMGHGRWYPSQVELADGRTVILSGFTEEPPGGVDNREVEVFTPGAGRQSVGSMGLYPSAERLISAYPHAYLLPDGDVLMGGPGTPLESAILDVGSFTWRQLDGFSRNRYAGTGVLLPGGPDGSYRAIQLGGYDDNTPQDPTGTRPATATAEEIDASAADPDWTPSAPLNTARSNHNTVLLPDGSMVTVGGARGQSNDIGGYVTYADGRARRVELWDPASKTWALGPAQVEDRAYHSIAMLLPDGRVLSAGDDFNPSVNGQHSSSDTGEIYSPPYLFKGSRPSIDSAPSQLRWGDRFGVSTGDDVDRVVLIAPGATTHATDMHQRHIELRVNGALSGRGVNVSAPPSPGVAPPGYYMMFALSPEGVPSVARWVQLSPDAPDQPELARPDLAAPVTGVRVKRAPARKPFTRTGRIKTTVSVDEPGTASLQLAVLDRSGRSIAVKSLSFRFSGAGEQTATTRFGRRVRAKGGRSPRVLVEVDATDAAGNASSSTLRLRATR